MILTDLSIEMDLETENRIAAILLKEAAELRRQAEEEGVLGYLRQPKVRGRPNSRFLTATVRGVQQANRAVEENEMWRARQKELELDKRLRGRSREESSSGRYRDDIFDSERNRSKRHDDTRSDSSSSCSLKKRVSDNGYLREDEGLRDDEVEEFLQSRIKRGRGDVGSRMDETGPYLPCKDSKEKQLATSNMERWEAQGNRVFYGPEKPALLRSHDTSEDESPLDKKKVAKKIGSSKQHNEKRKSKEKSKDKKKKKRREEKRKKHRKN